MSQPITIEDIYKLFEKTNEKFEQSRQEYDRRAAEAKAEAKAEADRRADEYDRRAAEAKAEADRRAAEAKDEADRWAAEADRRAAEADRRLAKLEKTVANTSRAVDSLTTRWGRFVEELVEPAVIGLFRSKGIDVKETYSRARVKRQGIAMEIDILAVDETDVDVFQGEPKQVQASNRSSVIVRVWNRDNQVGVTSTTDVDPVGLQLALKTAQEASFFGVKENVPDFSPAATAPTTEVASEMSNQAAVSTLIDKLLAAEKSLLAAHPAIASVPYNGLGQQQVRRFYLNSDGAMRQEARSYASVYLYTKTEQEGKKPRSAGAFRVSPGLEKLDIDGNSATGDNDDDDGNLGL